MHVGLFDKSTIKSGYVVTLFLRIFDEILADCLENRRFVKYYYTHSISKSGKNTHIGRAYAHTNGAIDCTEESKMKSLFVGMALGVIAGMALSEVPQVKDMLGKGKKKVRVSIRQH